MNEQIATVSQGAHVLFTGANGHVTYGITVKAIDPERSREHGNSVQWNINDNTLLKVSNEELMTKLGLTLEEAEKIVSEIRVLTLSNKPDMVL